MITPSAKADGFLGHARDSSPRFVPKAQSEPQNITGCVDISVNRKPAVRARVNTVSESFRNIRQASASGAYLRGSIGVDPDKPTTSLFHFVDEFGKERTPSRIANRTGEHTSGKGLDIQILNSHKPKSVSNLSAEFMLKVRPLVVNVGMSLLEKPDCLPSVVAALLPSGDFPLASSELGKSYLKIAGVILPFPIGQGNEGIKPHIYADNIRRGHRAFSIRHNTETGIPLAHFPFQSECFNLSKDKAVHLQFDNTDTMNFQSSLFSNVASIAPSGKGETVKSVFRLKTGIARFLASLDSAEESPEGFVHTPENILTGGKVSKFKIPCVSYLFKLISLVKVVKANPLHLPSVSTLLHRSIVKETGFRKLIVKQSQLLFSGIQAIFVGSALHLFALLRFYIMLDCRISHATYAGDVIRPAPESRQARTETRELRPENSRTISLELCGYMRWCLCWVGFHKQVNVVRQNLKAVNDCLHLICLLLKQGLQSRSHSLQEHSTAVFWTPHKMILERIHRSCIKAITFLNHTVSISHYYNNVKYLLREEVGQFPCQINQAVPLP